MLLSHKPHTYKVLIARKGQRAIKLSLRPYPVLFAAAVMMGMPTIGVAQAFYSLHQKNAQLSELSVSAAEVLEELEVLDGEVKELRQRAGLPLDADAPASSLTQSSLQGKGGVATELTALDRLELAKQKIPYLNWRLEENVKPALEATLKAEAARPSGMPTKGDTPISSEFGARPGPFGGSDEFHSGIDLIGPYATPIYATADGVVDYAGFDSGYGNHVVIKHSSGYETLYAHLSEMTVAPQAQVKRGQVIGYMGNTGRSTGTHLHYAIYYNQKAIDPRPFMIARR